LPLFLVGCGGSSLREDIASFISSFSYKKARSEVNKGSYVSELISKDVEGSIVTETESCSFDLTVQDVVSYNYSYIKNVDGQKTIKNKKVETIDNKYVLTYNGVTSEISYSEAYNITNSFFYNKYNQSTDYHYDGMYYGDIIKESALKQQDFVTIDKEKQLYTYNVPGVLEGNIVCEINYSVNQLGMLVNLKDKLYDKNNEEIYIVQTITVTY